MNPKLPKPMVIEYFKLWSHAQVKIPFMGSHNMEFLKILP
jgi:hypothetical protein